MRETGRGKGGGRGKEVSGGSREGGRGRKGQWRDSGANGREGVREGQCMREKRKESVMGNRLSEERKRKVALHLLNLRKKCNKIRERFDAVGGEGQDWQM